MLKDTIEECGRKMPHSKHTELNRHEILPLKARRR